MIKQEFDRNSHICTMHMQLTGQRSFSAEVTKSYRSGPQRTTKWPLNDDRVVTKLSQSLCAKAVHGWLRVYVSGVGGGVGGWGIYKSGLQGRLEAVEH